MYSCNCILDRIVHYALLNELPTARVFGDDLAQEVPGKAEQIKERTLKATHRAPPALHRWAAEHIHNFQIRQRTGLPRLTYALCSFQNLIGRCKQMF